VNCTCLYGPFILPFATCNTVYLITFGFAATSSEADVFDSLIRDQESWVLINVNTTFNDLHVSLVCTSYCDPYTVSGLWSSLWFRQILLHSATTVAEIKWHILEGVVSFKFTFWLVPFNGTVAVILVLRIEICCGTYNSVAMDLRLSSLYLMVFNKGDNEGTA